MARLRRRPVPPSIFLFASISVAGVDLAPKRAKIFALICLALALGGACKRPCETNENCKRTCDCVNSETGARQDCAILFRCEAAEGNCEADYDGLSCDDICVQYLQQGLCGIERCSADAECTKSLTCPVLDANNQPVVPAQSFDCTRTFACDQVQQLCDPTSTETPEQDCAFCRCVAAGRPDCVP